MFQVYVFEGLSKNVTCLGFYENGQFMYSGGEDCMARIWDLRYVKSALLYAYEPFARLYDKVMVACDMAILYH